MIVIVLIEMDCIRLFGVSHTSNSFITFYRCINMHKKPSNGSFRWVIRSPSDKLLNDNLVIIIVVLIKQSTVFNRHCFYFILFLQPMDKHTYSDRDYHYPDSPVHCKNIQYQRCENALCNDEDKDNDLQRCENCKVWRWRFVESNHLVVGDWFETAGEAEDANQSSIDRHAKKEVNAYRINTSHAELIHKFNHMKKRVKKSNERKREGGTLDVYFKEEGVFDSGTNVPAVASTICQGVVENIGSSDISTYQDKTVVTPNNNRKQVECLYCGNTHCHNKKFGKYLHHVCIDMVRKNSKRGIKTEDKHVKKMFRQRYHVLAEWDAFHLHGCTDVQQSDTNKMEMPECIKNGFFCTTVEHVEQMLMKEGV